MNLLPIHSSSPSLILLGHGTANLEATAQEALETVVFRGVASPPYMMMSLRPAGAIWGLSSTRGKREKEKRERMGE